MFTHPDQMNDDELNCLEARIEDLREECGEQGERWIVALCDLALEGAASLDETDREALVQYDIDPDDTHPLQAMRLLQFVMSARR